MAYRLAAQISRDRRLADAEEADFIAEAERLRARRETRERQEREQRQQQQEIVIRVEDGSRSPFGRTHRADLGLYEPRRRDDRERDRYALVPESTLREIRIREEEEAYIREREMTREVVRQELRAQLPITLPPPRRREARPLLDLTTGESLRRSEEVPRLREPIYNYVENRYGGDRRRAREASYEEVLYDDDLGVLNYDDQLVEEARIRREADEYARYMRQRREDELWEDIRRH